MSAEMENNKDEDVKEVKKKNLKYHIQRHWQIGIKILQLLICGACLGFIYEPANSVHLGGNHLHHVGIMYTAYTGYMLINSLFLIGRAIGDRISFQTIFLFAVNGAWLFCIAGILLLIDRIHLSGNIFHPRQYQLTMMTISTSLAFANSALFAVEAILIFLYRQDL